MNIEKESDLIKRISDLTGKSTSTLYDWKKKNSQIYEALKEYAHLKEKLPTNLNDIDYLKSEMIKAIDKLPESKTKKFYHLMMAELAEMGH